ncbi:MAG: hypothetical protein ABSG33_06325 [Candidatus Bathyarchaeia archaeon]|jgi:hypothetical protein
MVTKEDLIKQELSKTGFDFEDEIAAQMKELGDFDVQPNYCFIDWQTGEHLELDLRATYQVTGSPIRIEYVILVECKRIPGNAWSFIKNTGDVATSKNASSIWDNINIIGRQGELVEILKPTTKVNSLVADSHSNRFKEIIVDPETSNKRDDNILNCTTKLAKAIYFEQRMHEKNSSVLATQTDDIDYVKIYYPMVVFEGDIYEATMLPNLTVRQISSVHLDKFSIENKEEIGMTIDIVNSGNLKEFLKSGLLMEAKQIRSKEKKNRQVYIDRIHRIKQKKKLDKTWQQISGVLPKVKGVPGVGKIVP